jgi:hypothetical protein
MQSTFQMFFCPYPTGKTTVLHVDRSPCNDRRTRRFFRFRRPLSALGSPLFVARANRPLPVVRTPCAYAIHSCPD